MTRKIKEESIMFENFNEDDFLADLKADRLQFNELYFVDGYRISTD